MLQRASAFLEREMAKGASTLQLQGLIFATIFPFGYFLKFGVAWHDAGQPFNLTDVKFSA